MRHRRDAAAEAPRRSRWREAGPQGRRAIGGDGGGGIGGRGGAGRGGGAGGSAAAKRPTIRRTQRRHGPPLSTGGCEALAAPGASRAAQHGHGRARGDAGGRGRVRGLARAARAGVSPSPWNTWPGPGRRGRPERDPRRVRAAPPRAGPALGGREIHGRRCDEPRAFLASGAARRAAAAGIPATAIVLDLPAETVLARNAARPARVVDEGVVRHHLARLRASLDGPAPPLSREGFAQVVVLRDPDEVDGSGSGGARPDDQPERPSADLDPDAVGHVDVARGRCRGRPAHRPHGRR